MAEDRRTEYVQRCFSEKKARKGITYYEESEHPWPSSGDYDRYCVAVLYDIFIFSSLYKKWVCAIGLCFFSIGKINKT